MNNKVLLSCGEGNRAGRYITLYYISKEKHFIRDNISRKVESKNYLYLVGKCSTNL